MIETHVSRPIRSASASGPSGCAKPSFAIVSIASASATPSISAYAASLTNGMRMRFETKPGKSFASAGVLPRSSASATIALAVSSDVCTRADHLDELQHRHGVEEVHADDLLGAAGHGGERRDRDGRRVRGEDRGRWKNLVRSPEDRLLHLGVLDDRLDQEVGLDDLVDRRHALEHLLGSGASLLGELAEALLHRGERTLDCARNLVVERDAPPRGRDHLCDAAAHLAGADDEHVLEPHALSISDGGQTRGV